MSMMNANFLLFISAIIAATAEAEKTLYFSLIVSFGENNGYNSSVAIPAVNIALEHVNSHPNLLPGYRLEYKNYRNSQCSRSTSLDVFFQEIQSQQVKVAVLGCGCSVATEPVAEISHQWNISQISFASTVSVLNDRTRFRSFFRDFPTNQHFAPALLAIMNEFGWKRIAFLSQNENIFNSVYVNFKKLTESWVANESRICCFDNGNITITQALFESNADPLPAVREIFDAGEYKVFFLNSYTELAREVICEAAKRNLIYPSYGWIVYSWFREGWWWANATRGRNNDCTHDQLQNFVEKWRAIDIRQYPSPDNDSQVTVSGYTKSEIDEELNERIDNKTDGEYEQVVPSAGTFAYDAVWILALGLNRTLGLLSENKAEEATRCAELGFRGNPVPLEDFQYSNGYMGCVLRWSFSHTEFTGILGPVVLGENGTIVVNKLQISQYRDLIKSSGVIERVKIANVSILKNYSLRYANGENKSSVFPNGSPLDGTPIQVISHFKTELVVLYYFISFVGVLSSVFCLIFNFAFRKKKVIKLASPSLNYWIVAGSFLMFAAVCVGLEPSSAEIAFRISCFLYSWLFTVGYLLAFGTILAKMWRVYQIFHNQTREKTLPKDYQLMLIALLITGIGVLLQAIRSGFLITVQPFLVPDKELTRRFNSDGILEIYSVWLCHPTNTAVFYTDLVTMAYLMILQVVGLILAFQTRKVEVTGLNSAKFVASLVYTSSILLVILSVVVFSMREFINFTAAIFDGGILLMAGLFLGLTFLPMVYHLHKDPKGEKIFPFSRTPNTVTEDQVTILQKRIVELQEKLKEKAKDSQTEITN